MTSLFQTKSYWQSLVLYWADSSLDYHFKTSMEATSTQMNKKSSWKRNLQQKNTSICGNEIIISFHVSWPFCLVCGRSRFQFQARRKDCCRNTEHYARRCWDAESFCTWIVNQSRIWLLPKTFRFLFHLFQPPQRQSWYFEKFWLVYNSTYSGRPLEFTDDANGEKRWTEGYGRSAVPYFEELYQQLLRNIERNIEFLLVSTQEK
jgi:hypothetical protein